MKTIIVVMFATVVTMSLFVLGGEQSNRSLVEQILGHGDYSDKQIEGFLSLPQYPHFDCKTMQLYNGEQFFVSHDYSMALVFTVKDNCIAEIRVLYNHTEGK